MKSTPSFKTFFKGTVILILQVFPFMEHSAQTRVQNIILEPIVYTAGPSIANGVHAYISMDVLPGSELVYFNARMTNAANEVTEWSVINLPLLPSTESYTLSYVINVEGFGLTYESLRCAYTDTAWQTSINFVTSNVVTLIPQPVEYHVPSGSSDSGILIEGKPDKPKAPGKKPEKKETTYLTREKEMPNIDLDKSKDPTDNMACGPAAAANSLQWLKTQHKELQGDTTSLRSKTDSLKKYMNRSDAVGVRFDSMVVGKLTLIDQLKLPIKVKYKTKHGSGNPAVPLKSTKPPHHTADNKGAKDVFPDFDWLKKEMDDGEDVEVHVGWYGPPDKNGKRERKGGHWVVVSGYSIVKNDKGIYVKEDNDQRKKGGLRSGYFPWKTLPKTGEPYLENLKDDKGNIAIVESVVSESFDPTVKFDYAMSTIPPPWDQIDLTDVRMKPGYPFVVAGGTFPWIPVIIGAAAAGTAIYLLTDDDGDSPDDCSFTISAPTVSSTCGMANGSASIITNPPGDYTYVWSNGSTTSSITEVTAGTYSVTVTIPGTSCSHTLSVSISNNNPIFDTSFNTTDADCGQNNGSAIVTVTPPGTYTYQWSNGSTEQNQTNLAAGQYNLTVSAGGECVNSYSVQIGETPFDPNINITTSSAGCGLTDGTASVTVDPPGDYTYAWSNGQTGTEATGLAAGQYTVTVSVAGSNCTQTTTITVNELPAGHTVSVTTTSSGCGLTDGTASASVDPPGEYVYTWSNGQSGPQATGLGAGEYSVSVSVTGSSCTQTATFTIDELPAAHTVSVSTTPAGCGLTDGTATATIDPPGNYTYAWSNGQSGPEATGLAAGEYTVSVSLPGTECTQVATFTVDEIPAAHTVSVTTTSSGCGLTDGTATATVDPQGDYTYAWSNGQSGTEATGLGAGEYTVSVSVSGTNCITTTTFTVEELPAGHTVSVTTTPSGCGVTDGTATATVDPPGDYTYAWSNGQSGTEVTGLGAGEYTVSVSVSGTNCMTTTTFTVDELPTGHTVSVTTTSSGCGVTDGTATATVDPPGEYTYAWSNGQSGPQATGLGAGQYAVSVSVPGSSCFVIQEFTIDQSSGNFTGSVSTDDASCGLADGTATVTIDPPGEYIYEWSNGQTVPMADMLSSGVYTLVVTDTNQCSLEFSVTIGQDTADYISNVSIIPGTCVGDGEITFTLTTPGDGPLVFHADGPNGTTTQTLPPGTYQLSAFFPVSSGSYTLTAYDQTTGEDCLETVQANVTDNTPPLIANDDLYETPGGVPVNENALSNDSGLDIEMTSVSEEFGGTVTFLSTGEFEFIPDPGFSGDASFVYTVTDACGTTSTALVTIIVAESVCEFTTEFTFIPASCGLDDGSISVEVIEPGTYTYLWSNGDSGSSVSALFAGTYSVTITDVNLGCDLEFNVDLPENPAEHIDGVNITQPACGVEGEIQFTVTSNSQNPLVMSVDHPNGTDLFFIDAGVVLLSDFISVTAGDYIVEIFDAGAGAECSETLEVTLVATPSIEIIAEAVIPPTEPTAMDGIAIIIVTLPGTLPYEILLNGDSWGVALDNTFQIGGLDVGEYTIQIVDAEGCVSNVLTIFVPLPNIILSFGTSILQTDVEESNDVPESYTPGALWRSALSGSVKYLVGSVYQEVAVKYALPLRDQPGFVEMAYMTDIGRFKVAGIGMALQGGVGGHFEKRGDISSNQNRLPTYFLLRASGGYTIARTFRLQASLEMRCWEKLERPIVEIGLSVPFASFER